MGSESFETIFTSAELARFDFVFTFPNMVGCLEAEFHAAPIVTLRNFRRQRELNRYGGVIFTRADRNDINTVADLADKVVTGTSILLCQHQWRVFQENGMNMMGDVAQVSPATLPTPRLAFSSLPNSPAKRRRASGLVS